MQLNVCCSALLMVASWLLLLASSQRHPGPVWPLSAGSMLSLSAELAIAEDS